MEEIESLEEMYSHDFSDDGEYVWNIESTELPEG